MEEGHILFFEDERFNKVLNWPHDCIILWLGSNDIHQDSDVALTANHFLEIIKEIEQQ